MLIDSWECYTQTWTPAMEQEFERRRGYPLRRWLPALAGWVVDDHPTSERFLRDWRATISDLLVDNYFGRLAELGRERGLKLSFETAIGDVSPGDILQYFGRADIPMCEFWQPNDPHWGGLETKPIAPTVSAAHIYGKPRVAAEAFTSSLHRWDDHPFALKHLADRHFALGVTIWCSTPTRTTRSTVSRHFVRQARSARRFCAARPGGNTCPCSPITWRAASSCWNRGSPSPTCCGIWAMISITSRARTAPFPAGYHFDYLNADVLQNRLSVTEGKLITPEGLTWQVLWLPREQCRRLTPATLARIQGLLHEGATVVGAPPATNPSLSGGQQADVAFEELVRALWGPQPEASGDRRVGQGRLLWGDDLADTLLRLDIRPDVVGVQSATWCHRRVEGTEIYFVAAERLSPLNATVHFRAEGRPELWDPLTGRATPVVIYHQDQSGTRIPLELPAAGSVFVVFRPGTSRPQFERITFNGAPWQDATHSTLVDNGSPYPHFGIDMGDPLQPWVEPPPLVGWLQPAPGRFLAWADGTFAFHRVGQPTWSSAVQGTRRISLNTGWNLSFPPGWNAQDQSELAEVMPWSALADAATRAFSGTATYRNTVRLEAPAADTRLLLDLGRVADIAAVRINGQACGVMWAPPFRLDITPHVQAGDNEIEIAVTNTWHNRLTYDASLPEDERKTWTYASPRPQAPLQLAGLAGPVELRIGKLIDVPVP